MSSLAGSDRSLLNQMLINAVQFTSCTAAPRIYEAI